jgi:hypothetical protein
MKVQAEFQEPDKKKKIRRIIAREGLILLLVFIVAYSGADSFGTKSFMMDIGIVTPRPNEADAVLREAATAGFYFTFLVYGVIRFIIWAIRTLRDKN